MPKRQLGGLLVIGGVIVALFISLVAIASGTAAMETRSIGHLLMVACLGLLGVGLAMISVDGPIFGGTLARRGLRILAVGLIGLSVIFGLLILPVFDGYGIIILAIPVFLVFGATVIGVGLTVLALVAAGGRPRIVGATFIASFVALAANLFMSDQYPIDGPRPPAIAAAIVAGGALLLGFVGLALLAMGGLRRPLRGRHEGERRATG